MKALGWFWLLAAAGSALQAQYVYVANGAQRAWTLKAVNPAAEAHPYMFQVLDPWSGHYKPSSQIPVLPRAFVVVPLQGLALFEPKHFDLVDPTGRNEGGLVIMRTGTNTATMDRVLPIHNGLETLQVDASPGQPRAWILTETWGANAKAVQPVVKAKPVVKVKPAAPKATQPPVKATAPSAPTKSPTGG
jgi:hypothetical protein